MNLKLILSDKLLPKFNEAITSSNTNWRDINVESIDDFKNILISKIFSVNKKIIISEIIFTRSEEKSENYGYIWDEKSNFIIAYIFIIPPLTDSRSGFLAQHVMPVLSKLINQSIDSNSYEITNHPVYIINTNEFEIVSSKAGYIIGAKILGCRYIDVFNRDEYHYLKAANIYSAIDTLKGYDVLLQRINKQGINNYFTVDDLNKRISFKTTTLVDGTNTNERYFYTMKVFPALYLASKENYQIDLHEFMNSSHTTNPTLDAFLRYGIKLQKQ